MQSSETQETDMFDRWLANDPDGNKAELLVAALQELGAKDISTRPNATSKEHWDRMIENGRAWTSTSSLLRTEATTNDTSRNPRN